ncbi:hypothetical protein LCGC14_1830070 [marine sediment metagenome]|uniref:Glycosyltransferase 2-like domain-containing protein n=1 Tax=marine sediment metagenome TaxID=412755 RepID=A0A0F9GGD1_9ZZZZ
MSQTNKISGYTIARNVVKYKYPIRECLTTLRPICEDVVLAFDPYTDDGTDEVVKKLARDLDLTLFETRWNMDNIDKGLELGVQTDIAMEQCHNNWRLYLQLDEAFHEDDVEAIKKLPSKAEVECAFGIDFQRIYFYGNLHTIRKDWTAIITRLTYKDTHTYAQGDGMSCVPADPRWIKHMGSGLWMYHYSRLGDPELISKRVRNMDTFYHEDDALISESELPAYDFTTREWDNYAKSGLPPKVEDVTVPYPGTHPLPFAELYQEFE